MDVAFAKLTNFKKRRNVKGKNAEWNDTIRSCLKDLEKSTRVSFFLNMNNSQRHYLLEYYKQQFPFEGPMKTYMLDMADQRIKQNCATWKYRVTEGLIRHVNQLMVDDEKFRNYTVKKKIIRYLKGKFSLDTFAQIFDFVRDWINLGASNPKVHKWCKSLYVELASTAKMHVNWLNEPDETRLANSNYSRAAFSNRITTCANSQSWAPLVPSMDDIVLTEKNRPEKQKKVGREFLRPDDDNDFYVPGNSDSDD
ncbi:hypothetical protein O1611_g7798 [Lasiodiplodia mahajangana]|uniref:Uncharacterized protein n=1 Tax=Lasiodiplodia mahajangana TaxID=1108764 RepID=A0ACC2JED4_9PEZI|nr:hypothetical protein O1611_g7798 [Lasiodiplodia mahajangana]